jgi:membrane-associated protease RseP (regulator of RpoE activity)
MAANRLAEVRERAAMEAIVKLGGRVEFDRQVPIVIGNRRSVQIIIGQKWTGGVEGLKHLEAMRSATTLSFYSSPISGEIAAAALKPLLQLQRIEFYGTPASPQVVEQLHSLMPHVLVDIRGGARLGIAAGPDMPGGAQVGEVQPGTAAEKAGLMRDDVITEFGGAAVSDFKSLTAEIAKAKPGDSVKLKVLRPNPLGQPLVPLEIIVEFAEWNDEQAVNPGEGSPLSGLPIGMPSRMIINR